MSNFSGHSTGPSSPGESRGDGGQADSVDGKNKIGADKVSEQNAEQVNKDSKDARETIDRPSRLSLSDLLSLKSLQNGAANSRIKEFHDIVSGNSTSSENTKLEITKDALVQKQGKEGAFDAIRTANISKLLNDKAIKKQASFDPTEERRARDFRWTATRSVNASSNMGLFHPIGLRQHFNLRGVDISKLQKDDRSEKMVELVDDFLKNTMIDDHSLSPHAKRDLEETTTGLARAENFEDIIANSIHLARLLRHLQYIEESKKAVMLAMGVDPDNKLANQLFKELERVHPHDITFSPVKSPRADLNKGDLAKRIIELSKGRVSIVGDLLIDELLEGKPERISREAPVLILEHVDTLHIPGGAANTAHNITALGAKCHAIGVCGEDEYKEKLATMLESHGISHDLVPDRERPTTVKTRILSKSHSLMQQLLRLDRISHKKISADIEEQLAKKIKASAGDYQALILSDYKAGAITDSVIKVCREVTKNSKTILIVDAQNGFERFGGCSLITPNQPDTEEAIGFKIDSPERLKEAGSKMLELSGAQSILITRGSEGMALFQKGEPQIELPVFNKSEVFDVTGAGDTVVATMALALVTGASPLEAMALGNLAAGIVVKKSGTAVTSQKEMLDTLENLEI